jgi:hypothetical protein
MSLFRQTDQAISRGAQRTINGLGKRFRIKIRVVGWASSQELTSGNEHTASANGILTSPDFQEKRFA